MPKFYFVAISMANSAYLVPLLLLCVGFFCSVFALALLRANYKGAPLNAACNFHLIFSVVSFLCFSSFVFRFSFFVFRALKMLPC